MRIALIATTLAALAAPTFADTIHLTNGRTIDGTVTIEGGTAVIKTGSGIETRIPSERIARVVKGKTVSETLAERKKALKADDLKGHTALARWCKQHKLGREATALWEAIVARWPNEVEARLALNHVRHDGKWMTRAAYMRSLGLVKVGRSWVSKAEAKKRAEAEDAKLQRKKVEKLLRRVTLDGKASVLSKIQAYSDAVAVPALIKRGLRSSTSAVRSVAVQELGRRKAKQAERALAKTMVQDTKGSIRQAAMTALKSIQPGKAATGVFVAALGNKSLFQRVHALQGIYAFPDQQAVPGMIAKLIEQTGGWGTASISITTQRAYIQDYELSSGGTGPIVAEVANPTIGTQTTGVVLETKVKSWYRETLVQVLQKVTGQRHGADPMKWKKWWEDEGRKR